MTKRKKPAKLRPRFAGQDPPGDGPDPTRPSVSLLCKLGTLAFVTHGMRDGWDAVSNDDVMALVEDPEVNQWLAQMQKLALVPVKR